MQLKRNISKTNLLFLSVGSIVGSGWLFGSFYTAQLAGPAATVSWFLGGLFIGVIALTLAELSTMFPLSGGSTSYAELSHGRFCGALFSWFSWLWTVVVAPLEVQAVMQYSSQYFAGLLNPQTHNLTLVGFAVAVVLMFVLCFVNLVGVKFMADANRFISLWKLIIPIGIAVVFLTYHPHYENLFSHQFAPFGLRGILSSISTGGVAMSFFGFQTGIFLAGEAANPQKAVPFALFGSLIFCAVLYFLLQASFIVALSPESILGGWSHIRFEGDSGPFAGLLLSMGLVGIAKLLYVDAVVSPLGTGLALVASSSRILYAMGLQKDLPQVVSKLNRFSVPWVAVFVNFIVGLFLFLPFSGWREMASFLSAAIALSLVCSGISLPVFREKLPDHHRPYVLPYARTFSFLSFLLCSLIMHWTGYTVLLKLDFAFLVILAVCAVTFLANPSLRQEGLAIKSGLWVILYLVLSLLLSYISTFDGGIGLVGEKTSMFGVFLMCIGVNFIAQRTALPAAHIQKACAQLLLRHNKP